MLYIPSSEAVEKKKNKESESGVKLIKYGS